MILTGQNKNYYFFQTNGEGIDMIAFTSNRFKKSYNEMVSFNIKPNALLEIGSHHL